MFYKIITILIEEFTQHANNPNNNQQFRDALNQAIQSLNQVKKYL